MSNSNSRFLRPTSDRSFEVHDGGIKKGVVWRPANDPETGRWRASDPSGQAEWRPWAMYSTPQDAAKAVIREYDRRAR